MAVVKRGMHDAKFRRSPQLQDLPAEFHVQNGPPQHDDPSQQGTDTDLRLLHQAAAEPEAHLVPRGVDLETLYELVQPVCFEQIRRKIAPLHRAALDHFLRQTAEILGADEIMSPLEVLGFLHAENFVVAAAVEQACQALFDVD